MPSRPEPGELGHQLAREGGRLEVVADDGEDALAHHRPHRVADQALVVAEQVVDGVEVGGAGQRRRAWRACVVVTAGLNHAAASAAVAPAAAVRRARPPCEAARAASTWSRSAVSDA